MNRVLKFDLPILVCGGGEDIINGIKKRWIKKTNKT